MPFEPDPLNDAQHPQALLLNASAELWGGTADFRTVEGTGQVKDHNHSGFQVTNGMLYRFTRVAPVKVPLRARRQSIGMPCARMQREIVSGRQFVKQKHSVKIIN